MLTAGDVPGQEPRECRDVFGSPWQLVDGGICDLGSINLRSRTLDTLENGVMMLTCPKHASSSIRTSRPTGSTMQIRNFHCKGHQSTWRHKLLSFDRQGLDLAISPTFSKNDFNDMITVIGKELKPHDKHHMFCSHAHRVQETACFTAAATSAFCALLASSALRPGSKAILAGLDI